MDRALGWDSGDLASGLGSATDLLGDHFCTLVPPSPLSVQSVSSLGEGLALTVCIQGPDLIWDPEVLP